MKSKNNTHTTTLTYTINKFSQALLKPLLHLHHFYLKIHTNTRAHYAALLFFIFSFLLSKMIASQGHLSISNKKSAIKVLSTLHNCYVASVLLSHSTVVAYSFAQHYLPQLAFAVICT